MAGSNTGKVAFEEQVALWAQRKAVRRSWQREVGTEESCTSLSELK